MLQIQQNKEEATGKRNTASSFRVTSNSTLKHNHANIVVCAAASLQLSVDLQYILDK
jgi:hypothetical protein